MIALVSHASKMMLKILQTRLQQYVTENFHMDNMDVEKAKEPEIKLPTSVESLKKHGSFRKKSISALLTVPKINHVINATTEFKYTDHSLVHDFHLNQVEVMEFQLSYFKS